MTENRAHHFSEVAHFVSNGIPVRKYRSSATGLTIALAEVEGPVVNGFFTLSTEGSKLDYVISVPSCVVWP